MSEEAIVTVNNQFSTFEDKKNQLHGLFAKALDISRDLKLTRETEKLEKSLQQLDGNSFKTLIIGEFKRGKSTFINALLGQEVLPAYAIPCTAVINEVKWGPEKKAILHFANPFPEKTSYELAPDVQKHVDAHKGEAEIPPMEIPADRVEEFVVIPDPGKDQAESIFESPYKKVELFWPLDLLKNNVEIIDSPGLNEHKSRSQVTNDYLGQADAIIFVMTCSALASASEMDVIDNTLRRNGFEDLFFVCNRFDELRATERDRVIKYAHSKLDEKTELRDGIQFVSSAKALDAKIEGNATKLEEAGFVKLEENLITFLVDNRGRLKLVRPAKDLKKFINDALLDFIPNKEKMFRQNYASLKENFEKAKPGLEKAKLEQKNALNTIEDKRKELRTDAGNKFENFLKLQSLNVQDWLKDYEPQNGIKFLTTTPTTEQAKVLIQECSEFVGQKIAEAQAKWEDEDFKPFLDGRLTEMGKEIEGNLEGFYSGLLDAKCQITGEPENTGVEKVGAMERVLSAAGGFIIGGVGSAAIGATLGYKEMLKSLIPSIAIVAGAIFLGVVNPFVLIPLLLGAGGIQSMLSMKSLGKKIKDKAAENIAKEILEKADENGKTIGQAIFEKTQEFQDMIKVGMDNEIKAVTDNYEGALATLQQGEVEIKQETEKLDTDREQLRALLTNVEDLIDNA